MPLTHQLTNKIILIFDIIINLFAKYIQILKKYESLLLNIESVLYLIKIKMIEKQNEYNSNIA